MKTARKVSAPRPPLSRERVLEAAIALADASGTEALTMRRLAQELGVEAMSLYHHVANKEAILDAMVDSVMAEIELPAPGLAWKEALRGTAIAAHRALLRHRWAAAVMLGSSGSASRLRYMNSILGTLREAGFSPSLTDRAYHALDSHIMGFTLWVVGMQLPRDADLAALASSFLASLPGDEYPYLVEHIEQHMNPPAEGAGDDFTFGLDLILDGLERSLAAAT